MLQLFNCFFALCLRNWLSARVFFLPVWAKRMRSRAVSPPYNMCGHYCKRGPHAKNTCNEPISTNRSYSTGKKQTTLTNFFLINLFNRFLLYYLYSITARTAAPQTILWGGPGPRFEPGPGGPEASHYP